MYYFIYIVVYNIGGCGDSIDAFFVKADLYAECAKAHIRIHLM